MMAITTSNSISVNPRFVFMALPPLIRPLLMVLLHMTQLLRRIGFPIRRADHHVRQNIDKFFPVYALFIVQPPQHDLLAHAPERLSRHFSAQIEIRFHLPAKVGETLNFKGLVHPKKGRLIIAEGEATDLKGRKVASGTAKLMKIDHKTGD